MNMKERIEKDGFNTKLETSDWRFSASILGIIKYLKYHDLNHKIEDDYILYNSEDITEERYLEFVEYLYDDELHHRFIENLLNKEDVDKELIKLINAKLVNKDGLSNTIVKKVFEGVKFDGTNQNKILDKINKNRNVLIKETFRYKKNMYANYSNTGKLLSEDAKHCRILGYYTDVGKKGRSVAYNFDQNTYVGEDVVEFDFIPFAFVGDRESFFVNDSFSVKKMKQSNDILVKKIDSIVSSDTNDKKDARKAIFKLILESSDFLDYDVEIIIKSVDNNYFETLYIRKDAIDIFKKMNKSKENIDYDAICFSKKVTDKYYIDFQKEITGSIINGIVIDELIEMSLKDEKSHGYKINQMIKINALIKGGKMMNWKLEKARGCAKAVSSSLEKNKVNSYKQKLISAVVFKDYDKACTILLQLSSYSGVEFDFAYDLFENFEENKDIAYSFINALGKKEKNENKQNINNEGCEDEK